MVNNLLIIVFVILVRKNVIFLGSESFEIQIYGVFILPGVLNEFRIFEVSNQNGFDKPAVVISLDKNICHSIAQQSVYEQLSRVELVLDEFLDSWTVRGLNNY